MARLCWVLRNEKRYELNITLQKHRIYGENERKTTEKQEQKKKKKWLSKDGSLKTEIKMKTLHSSREKD